jgi:hypothetical protein
VVKRVMLGSVVALLGAAAGGYSGTIHAGNDAQNFEFLGMLGGLLGLVVGGLLGALLAGRLVRHEQNSSSSSGYRPQDFTYLCWAYPMFHKPYTIPRFVWEEISKPDHACEVK